MIYSYLSLGRLHLPVFGIFVALGLMAAMGLSQLTARMAKVDPLAVWDLGLVAVFSAFLVSRVLQVLENLLLFVHYPVLVLELPAITLGGVIVTAAIAWVYLRRRQLPLLATLDALSPCVALAYAFASFGGAADGTREGMPTTVAWAVQSPFGKVHPVEVYSGIAWLLLCALSLVLLRFRRHPGDTVVWALFWDGLAIFVLDFYQLPPTLYGNPFLENIQWKALALMLAAVGFRAVRMLLDARAAREVPHAV